MLAANKSAKAMASDPRYDMRAHLRQKLSQKDYLDKDMRKFHYASNAQILNGVPSGFAGLTPQQIAQMQQLQAHYQVQMQDLDQYEGDPGQLLNLQCGAIYE